MFSSVSSAVYNECNEKIIILQIQFYQKLVSIQMSDIRLYNRELCHNAKRLELISFPYISYSISEKKIEIFISVCTIPRIDIAAL